MCKFKSLTSLTHEEYERLYKYFWPLMKQKVKHFSLKGKRRKYIQTKESKLSSLYGSRAKLDFILRYLKENPTQTFMGEFYQFSQSKVSEWVAFILPVLEVALSRIGVMPQRMGAFNIPSDLDCILCDVTERQIHRSIDYEVQKEYYSGKKKAHTVKNIAFSSTNGYIHYLGETFEGSIHDKTLWDVVELNISEVNILVDLGFLGADKDHENVVLPYKNSKNKPITSLQKKINQEISKIRVRVEHAFSGVKRLRAVKEILRLKRDGIRDLVMEIAVGLHNLRVKSRHNI